LQINRPKPGFMRKIRNPFEQLEGYNCFGCSSHNPIGLHLSFIEEDEEIVTEWEPCPHFQGYHNVLHGGIQATLMDEIASWTVYVKVKTSGVTSKAEIKYLKPVYIDKGKLTLRARLVQMRRNLADIEVDLLDNTYQLCAKGMLTFFTFPREKSTESLYYPAPDEFFEKE